MRTGEGRGPARRGGSRDEGGTQYRYRNRLPCRGMPRNLRFRGGTPSRGSRGFASASSAPKGRNPSAQGSALGTVHTPDSQPRRGAIAGRAVPMDCRYAAPAGLHLVLDSFPGRCPGLRNGRAFSAPRRLAFATRPAGSLPQESRDPFCSPDAETIETETPTKLTCARLDLFGYCCRRPYVLVGTRSVERTRRPCLPSSSVGKGVAA